MSKKIKVLIAIGGTGGHVFPGCNLAEHLRKQNYDVYLTTDKRGSKFLNAFKDLNYNILPFSPLIKKNIVSLFYSTFLIIYSIFKSLLFLIRNRPFIIFGMGGYASFPICIAAKILNIRYIIYENNLIIGKANKYLLPFSEKIFVSHKELEGVPSKYQHKCIEIGNIIKKEIISFSDTKEKNETMKKINILVLGGSQAAKVFAETLPYIFKKCVNQGIDIKVYQHCLSNQNEQLKFFYETNNIDFEIFNFSNNIVEYFSKANIAITRSGSSILAELTNSNIPFICIPLPSSADNHQLKNAMYYTKKNFGFLVEEKDLYDKLFNLIREIKENNSILTNTIHSQRQYSDKYVYNNIDKSLKEIIYEKN